MFPQMGRAAPPAPPVLPKRIRALCEPVPLLAALSPRRISPGSPRLPVRLGRVQLQPCARAHELVPAKPASQKTRPSRAQTRESGFDPTVNLAEPDRNHRGERGGNDRYGGNRAIGPAPHHETRSPVRCSGSSWVRNDMQGPTKATTSDAKNSARPRARQPAMIDAQSSARERTLELLLPRRGSGLRATSSPLLSPRRPLRPCPCQGQIERRNQSASFGHLGALATGDHHQVPSFGKRIPAAAKPLADRPLDTVSLHGIAHSATRTDPDPARISCRYGQHQEHELAGCNPASLTGNPFEFSRVAQAIGPPEAAGRSVHNYFDATVVARRLRPLARRRFRIARPERVFIRSRKPCFRSRLIRLG